MGIAFKAKGNVSFGLLLIRLTVGSLFLIAGTKKLLDIEAFITYTKSLEIMPDNMAFIFGFILPFAEMFLGGLYIIGFLTPFTSLSIFAIVLGFIITLGGNTVPQGNFSIPEVYYYIVLIACSLTTMFGGAGAVSIDYFLDKNKKQIPVVAETPSQDLVNEEIIVQSENSEGDNK